MTEEKQIVERRRRPGQILASIPDKYLALAIFTALLVIYLFTKNQSIEQMMYTIFGLVVVALNDGIKRVSAAWSARSDRRDERPPSSPPAA